MSWETRPPAEIQMGNGTMLCTFDSMGELEQLFAPHIDALGSRLGSFRSAILLYDGPRLIPVVPEEFESRVFLRQGSQVLECEYQHRSSGLRVTRTVALHPTDPVILDSWQVFGARAGVLHQSIPWMSNATSGHCSLYHPSLKGLVHHRGRRWVAVLVRGGITWTRVGHLSDPDRHRLWEGDRIFAPVGAGDLGGLNLEARSPQGWDQVVQGPAVWGALATRPDDRGRSEFMILCAQSEDGLVRARREIENIETTRFLQMIDGMSARRHGPAAGTLERIHHPRIRALAERSLDVLHALQDSTSGALMAAAEVDPHSRLSGGYGYSWPRDGAFLAAALGAWGYRDRVEHYFRFLAETQDPSGTWWQRYLASGHAGPSWGRIQIDEPASAIGLAYVHYRRTQDLFWLEKLWPVLERGLGFLESFHGPEHPLGQPSHDLWEERMGIHAYSLGAVAAAFRAASELARELNHERQARHYGEWGLALSTLISERFVGSQGPVRRSLLVNSWDYMRGGGSMDETPDVSLLGLIHPFGIINKRDAAAERILELVRGRLWHPGVGGVLRYEGDHYRGGNPWILTTLWLGIVELSLKNWGPARRCLDWTLSKATAQGMLAEQVHRETGKPSWVIPLAWSHAMFLLFIKEVLDRQAETEIWG